MAYNSYINFRDTTLERHYSKSYRIGGTPLSSGYSDVSASNRYFTSGNTISTSNSAGSVGTLLGYGLSNVRLPNFNNFIQHGQCNVPSGTLGVYSPQVVRLRKTKVKPVTTFDDNYKKLYGIPVNKVISLSSITGFTQLTDFHIEGSNFSQCTTDELNALDSLLRGGIIL